MRNIGTQLELLGLNETVRQVEASGSTPAERRKIRQQVETMHELMSELPTGDDLRFQHGGLCQTFLPHSRPKNDTGIWRRQSGNVQLTVEPGSYQGKWLGVPYGAKARLILIHLQTEGMKGPTVHLGESLTAFLRSLGLPSTGGKRGTLPVVKDQVMRILRCRFSIESTKESTEGSFVGIQNLPISNKQILWTGENRADWSATLELTPEFHAHLKAHAVPLDKRGIAHLAGNSLGLDLYSLLAYRLPRIGRQIHIRWASLREQVGSDYNDPYDLAKRVRAVMPDVMVAYPHAKVDVAKTGLTLKPSAPSVPGKTQINGFRVIEGEKR
jgi:hypothetical protein